MRTAVASVVACVALILAGCSSESPPAQPPSSQPAAQTPPEVTPASGVVSLTPYSDESIAIELPADWSISRAGSVLYAVSDPSDTSSARLGFEIAPSDALESIAGQPRALRGWLKQNIGGRYLRGEVWQREQGGAFTAFEGRDSPFQVVFLVIPDVDSGRGLLGFLAARKADYEAVGGHEMLDGVMGSAQLR